MIRHTTLREIIGADALIAHARTNLTAAHTGDGRVQLFLLDLVKLRCQHTHTFFTVLQLGALFLTGHHNAAGLVDQANGRRRLVNVLATCARCTVNLHLNIRRIDLHVHLFHFRKHGYRCRRSVDTAAGFRLRYTLHTMDTGFIFHTGVRTPTVDDEVRFLDTAQFRFVVVHQFDAPVHAGSVHAVHTEQTVGKQGAFLAANTAANLHNDAFFVIGVFRQQQDLEFIV